MKHIKKNKSERKKNSVLYITAEIVVKHFIGLLLMK